MEINDIIEMLSERKKTTPIDFSWREVITEKGVMAADEAMKEAGFLVDSSVPISGLNIQQINSLGLDSTFLGYGELSLLQSNALINNICTIMADSMTEKWIQFGSNESDKRERIEQLEAEFERFGIKPMINECIYKSMLLGTSYISPKIEGDEDDLKNPLYLSPSKIGIGSVEAFYPIEPTWVIPIDFNMNKPRAKNFYKPQAFNVFGETLQATRMMQFTYIKPVNLMAPMYLFGGIPLVQVVLPYILDYMSTKREIVNIVSRLNTSILKTNINALAGKDIYGKATTTAGSVKTRGELFNSLRNNFGLFLINDNEEFSQVQIPLTGLSDILQQQAELISLILRIPVSKLFGQAPRGFNATGEFDSNNFEDLMTATQESMLRSNITRIMKILMLNLWGEIDTTINFDFVPLGAVDETKESELKTAEIQRAKDLVDSNIFTRDQVADHLISDPKMGFEEMGISGVTTKIEGENPDGISV